MKTLRPFLILVALAMAWGASAQTPPGWNSSGGSVALAVTSTSASVALPGGSATPVLPNLKVCNTGSAAAYIAFGGSGIVAYSATSGANLPGSYLPGGVCQLFSPGSATYVAAITATGTTTLVIESGSGSPQSIITPGTGLGMKTDASNATAAALANMTSVSTGVDAAKYWRGDGTWQTIAPGFTGSLTPGTIPKATGATALGDSGFSDTQTLSPPVLAILQDTGGPGDQAPGLNITSNNGYFGLTLKPTGNIGGEPILEMNGFGTFNEPNFYATYAAGTPNAPTAIGHGGGQAQTWGIFNLGYNGNSYSTVFEEIAFAAEAWDASHHGAYWKLRTTDAVSQQTRDRIYIDGAGDVELPNSALIAGASPQGVTATSAVVGSSITGTASYAPGDNLTLAAIGPTAPSFNVTNTKAINGAVDVAGTGGTNGAGKIVTGTTGTGTKFQASVTVSGGGIVSVDSISVAGNYTVNPTDIAHEPVTGDGLTGAKLLIGIWPLTVALANGGSMYTLPSNDVATTNSGTGTGAKLTVAWNGASLGAGDVLVGSSLVCSSAVGGSQGAGTINCSHLYKDGVEVNPAPAFSDPGVYSEFAVWTGANAIGGALSVTAPTAATSSSDGRNVQITAGTGGSSSGDGGLIGLVSGAPLATNGNGAKSYLNSSNGSGTGFGGGIELLGGKGGSTGGGGAWNGRAGDGGSSNGVGGLANLYGGASLSQGGATLDLYGGTNTTGSQCASNLNCGDVFLQGGSGLANNIRGGDINITAGTHNGSGRDGQVIVSGAITTSGNITMGGSSTLSTSSGGLTISPNAGLTVFTGPVRLQGYTVASLPAGGAGDIAYVTDQLTACPVLAGTFTGGGAVKCAAFYNGTAWVHE